MSLELDGKPFSLSEAETKKYSKKMIFRAGRQFINKDTSGDPERPQIEVGNVHIETSYNHYAMKSGVRMAQGKLVYFENKNYDDTRKKWDYTPPMIEMGYRGSQEINNVELAYFLDNHPHNETVKGNVEHPNYDAKKQPYFATYRRENVRDEQAALMQLAAKLVSKIFSVQEMSNEEIKSIAQLTVKSSRDYNMAHKIFDPENMSDADFRAELARLVNLYPKAMEQIITSKSIDNLEWVNKFSELMLIALVNDEWQILDKTKGPTSIMKVTPGTNAENSLADWFENFDTKGNKFAQIKAMYDAVMSNRKKSPAAK